MLYIILAVFAFISTYIFTKRYNQIQFMRKQSDEIFIYLESIIILQKYLIQEETRAIEYNNIVKAKIIYDILNENFNNYDIIKEKLYNYLNFNKDYIPWKVKFQLPLFYSIDDDNNKIFSILTKFCS